jgi:hypothetical protein
MRITTTTARARNSIDLVFLPIGFALNPTGIAVLPIDLAAKPIGFFPK